MVVEGSIEVTGKSYVPTEACVWVNLTQVQLNGREITTVISNNPAVKAVDVNGSDGNVKGEGSLNVLPETINVGRICTLHHVKDNIKTWLPETRVL